MVAVVLGSIVSIALALFALAVTYREFQRHWPQIAAALAFDVRVSAAPIVAEVRRPAAPRQAWPSPVRVQAMRRAAA